MSGLVSKSQIGKRMSMFIQSLFPIPCVDTYIDPLSFLFFLVYLSDYYWCDTNILTSAWIPLRLLLPLEPAFTGFTYSSLHWNPLFLSASPYILLLPSKILLPEDSLFIVWFKALGICFNNDLGWLESLFMHVEEELLLLKGLKVPLFKLSVASRKSTI